VTTILGQRLPVTAELLIYALVGSVVLAVLLAVLAARRPNGIADRFQRRDQHDRAVGRALRARRRAGLPLRGQAPWFPAIGYTSLTASPLENIRSLTLPAIAIGFPLFAVYTRLLRADIVEQMQREDYIVTARDQGRAAVAHPDQARAAKLDVLA